MAHKVLTGQVGFKPPWWKKLILKLLGKDKKQI